MPHSSQALAIDVFGTLQTLPQEVMAQILGSLADDLSLPSSGPWELSLEWRDPSNVLCERKQTQVDAVAESERVVIFFECKFTETNGGACSQPLSLVDGVPECNGNYAQQTNPKNGKSSLCALSGKGIRYWDTVPKILAIDASAEYSPCPFRYSQYQWMRNLAVARASAEMKGKMAAFVVVYVQHPGLSFPYVLQTEEWKTFASLIRRDQITFATMTYQDFCANAIKALQQPSHTLSALEAWVLAKIATVTKDRPSLVRGTKRGAASDSF